MGNGDAGPADNGLADLIGPEKRLVLVLFGICFDFFMKLSLGIYTISYGLKISNINKLKNLSLICSSVYIKCIYIGRVLKGGVLGPFDFNSLFLAPARQWFCNRLYLELLCPRTLHANIYRPHIDLVPVRW